jgi:hypothetical protein
MTSSAPASVALWIHDQGRSHFKSPGALPDAAPNICPELRAFARLGEIIFARPRYESKLIEAPFRVPGINLMPSYDIVSAFTEVVRIS